MEEGEGNDGWKSCRNGGKPSSWRARDQDREHSPPDPAFHCPGHVQAPLSRRQGLGHPLQMGMKKSLCPFQRGTEPGGGRGGWKPEIKVGSGLVPPRASGSTPLPQPLVVLPWHSVAGRSLSSCPRAVSLCAGLCIQIPVLIRTPVILHQDLPSGLVLTWLPL